MIGISQSFRQLGRPPPHHLLHHSHFPPNENSYHPPWSRLHYIHSPLNPLNHIIWSSPPSHLNCRQQSSSGRFMLMQRLQHNWWVNWLEQRLHSIRAEICGDLTQKCAGGGRFLADSSCMCWGGAFFWRIHLALHWFVSLLPPLTRVLSLLVPKELYLTLDWRRHFGCDLHIADCMKKKRELFCCLTLSLGAGMVRLQQDPSLLQRTKMPQRTSLWWVVLFPSSAPCLLASFCWGCASWMARYCWGKSVWDKSLGVIFYGCEE